MKIHSKHITATTITLMGLVIVSMSTGTAFAHKSEVIGDYKIEIGWENEPPIAGIENAIELVISYATEFEKSQSSSETHEHSHEDDSMEMEHDDSMNMEGDMSDGKSAEELHNEAKALEEQGNYAEAAELHHQAGNILHDEAEALEEQGNYAEAAELHHQAAEHHHEAAVGLEKISEFAEAAEHHHEAAEHHHLAAEDLEKISEFAEAAEHHDEAAEHHELAAMDLEKVGLNDEAQEHITEAEEHKELAELDREKADSGDMTMSEHDHDSMEMEDSLEGEKIPDLADSLQLWITLGGDKTELSIVESNEFSGVYFAKYLPESSDFPIVDLHGEIIMTDIDVQMHPEEVEPLSTLAPHKQMKNGINPSDVECKEGLDLFMRTNDSSAVCIGQKLQERMMSLGIIDYF